MVPNQDVLTTHLMRFGLLLMLVVLHGVANLVNDVSEGCHAR